LLYYFPREQERRQQIMKNQRKDTLRICAEKQVKILFAAGDSGGINSAPDALITKNISMGGLCALSDAGIEKGTVMAAEIILEHGENGSIKVYCESRWTRKPGESGRHETGMQFISFRGDSEKHLKEFIESQAKN
jgi:c-di-GMP-binding flagellar brake protein YcgR